MTTDELLRHLRRGFPDGHASGVFDVSSLPGNPYGAWFAEQGLPASLALRSKTGWVVDGASISLGGSTSTDLLGLQQPTLFIRFQQVEQQWLLLFGFNLPFDWTYRQSFPQASRDILETLVCRSLLAASAPLSVPLDWLQNMAEPQREPGKPDNPPSTLNLDGGLSLYGWDSEGREAIAVAALDALLDQRTVTITLSLDSPGLPDAGMLDNFYGQHNGIAAGLPAPCVESPSLLRVKTARCGVSPINRSVIHAFLRVDAFSGEAWDIWPGVIALHDIRLRYSSIRRAEQSSVASYGLDAGFDLAGLPLLIKARLPVSTLSGSLDPALPPPALKPFAQTLFGHSSALPDNLLIRQLDFHASPPRAIYGAALSIDGALSFAFGDNHQIRFEALQLKLDRDSRGTSGHLHGLFHIDKDNQFDIDWSLADGNTRISGQWQRTDTPLDFRNILAALGLPALPDLPGGVELGLTEARFEFDSEHSSFVFEFQTQLYHPDTPGSGSKASAALVAGRNAMGTEWGYLYGMVVGLDLDLSLTRIPLVGDLLPAGNDSVRLERLRLVAASRTLPTIPADIDLDSLLGGPVSSGVTLAVDLQVGSLPRQTLAVSFAKDEDSPPPAPAHLEGASGEPAEPAEKIGWIKVQRAFGPIQIQRIGFTATPAGRLGVLFDAAVDIRGLSIGLSGLEADIPLKSPFVPAFDLAGLAVQFDSPSLSISGALGRSPGSQPVQYSGELAISAGTFGATALGSYTTINGEPSLTAFAFINEPLGGPPYFFVTGLAGGFGYNRTLTVPDIEQLDSFPLIQGAMGHIDASQTRQRLDDCIRPMAGQDWFAAGVRFTSFEMLKSFALLTLSFGTRTEIALLGQSNLSIPPSTASKPKDPVAQADLLIRVCLQLDEGLLAVNAQLAPSSYVFSRDARLSGGFAFYLWFGDSPHAGDFVVTLGGYHPHFKVPAHYPKVPRLGLNWRISDNLTLKGELYFALTPSVIMAGGLLDATWQSGGVKAWFNVRSDFLIRFKPFAYWIEASVSIGVSVDVDLWITSFTVTVHVGVDLQLWGPSFGGLATVDLWIVSFTIDFGSSHRPGDQAIDWQEFRESFLPAGTPAPRGEQNLAAPAKALITISAPTGILTTFSQDGEQAWAVNGATLCLVIGTQMPSTHLSGSDAEPSPWTQSLGIGPMGKARGALKSELSVRILRDGEEDDDAWAVDPVIGGVPSGLWSNTGNGIQPQAVIDDALQGLTLRPRPPQTTQTLEVASQILHDGEPLRLSAAWSASRPPGNPYGPDDDMAQLQATLVAPEVSATRRGIFAALRRQGLETREDAQLDDFARHAPELLLDAPQPAPLGAFG